MNGNRRNPLLEARKLGQSIWLDLLSRELMRSGKLASLIRDDGLAGVTSNPTIFEKAFTGSRDYDGDIRALAEKGLPPEKIYETIAAGDVREAADLFLPLYEETKGADGFVSIEVSPSLARDTEGTVREAERLRTETDRPNVMIKVPGTAEGIPAIRRLTAQGFSINVTLLFGLERYRAAAQAYVEGIEERLSAGKPVESISSVASFFLSRIDVLVDPILETYLDEEEEFAETASYLRGRTAIACAKVARTVYRDVFEGPRFRDLERHGARRQRLLWASTGTKNPQYSDVKYVEPLIGSDTVNTVPLETLEAFRDHGSAEDRLDRELDEAKRILSLLPTCGVYLTDITSLLEEDGIRKFADSFDKLKKAVEKVTAR